MEGNSSLTVSLMGMAKVVRKAKPGRYAFVLTLQVFGLGIPYVGMRWTVALWVRVDNSSASRVGILEA